MHDDYETRPARYYGAEPTTCGPVPIAEIPGALQRQTATVDALEGAAKTLEERLNPCLHQVEEADGLWSREGSSTELALTIDQHNARIEAVADRLNSILARLAL